jgi:glycosyltransferase involved in cell wall biosynthesis
VEILPNGIDTAFWRNAGHPERAPRPKDPLFNLVSVMRLNAKKRPLALIEMMRRLNTRARLRIVGDGPLRPSVERAIARHGLGDRVQLLGYRCRDEIRALFTECDVFVSPAIRESFGLAAIEARCAGLPVVAMARSGVAEWIEHGRAGLLAHSDDELRCHVDELAVDDALRASIAAHNREMPPAVDWDAVVGAHLESYDRAASLRDYSRTTARRASVASTT